jgi:hypothetical protein
MLLAPVQALHSNGVSAKATYAAPTSYVDVDLNLRYRIKLAGDDRERGVFVGLTFAY